jgi:hypothetical protein
MNLMKKYLRKVEGNNVNDPSRPESQDAIKSSIAEDKAISKQVFEKKFNELADTLSLNTLTADDIKTQRPGLYKKIQAAIDEMDSAWLKEDLEVFSKAIKTIEELYFQALREIPEG